MQLRLFIVSNMESILQEWETFARSIWPSSRPSLVLLRDHAEAILRAAVSDMGTRQSATEQTNKSKGDGTDGAPSVRLDDASKHHALGRVRSGFDLMALVAEYRALRASVIRLWSAHGAALDPDALVDLTRFNETIDQSLAEAVRHFSAETDRSREIFLGILGHDLRNPLNAILLSAQSLAEISRGETAALASQIASSGEAMARLLTDFTDFTACRLGAGLPLASARADLATLCQAVVEESRASFGGADLTLQLSGDLTGQWDANRLRQLLSNLIGNAIQHGAPDSPVRVSAAAGELNVVLRIQNAGEPIPAELIPRLFDPLVQAPGTDRKARRPGSMGLGLYIAKEVVAAHGGDIEVTSSAEAGTEFTVTLPRGGK